MRRFILALPFLAVFGCASTATTSPSQQAAIAGLESALTAADVLALQYTTLPACPAPAPCAAPAMKTQIKSAALLAFNTLNAAKVSAMNGGSVDLTAATAALTALQGLVTANATTIGK